MADTCTACSNNEQFTLCIHWTDSDQQDHESFIGLYQVETIDADCLFGAIKDVLLRMGVQLARCRGQCYDGASNMSGATNGAAAKITAEEGRALYTHCYGHALNLAVPDSLRRVKAYLRSTMRQDRLNHAMVPAIYKEAWTSWT